MSFFEHLAALRHALVWAIVPIIILTFFAFTVRLQRASLGGIPVYYPLPATVDNLASQILNRARADLIPEHVMVVAGTPTDAFFGLFCAAGIFGVVLGMPFAV